VPQKRGDCRRAFLTTPNIKERSVSKTKYVVKRATLNHDLQDYADGEVIELEDGAAAPLLTLNPPAIEVAEDGAPVTDKSTQTASAAAEAEAKAVAASAQKTVAAAKSAKKKAAK
jgi:hypothetical protein